MDTHRALDFQLSMISSENRFPLFRIMLWLIASADVKAVGENESWWA
jgi:hypothetical protein